jgi:TrmH family RNA methyltransferase
MVSRSQIQFVRSLHQKKFRQLHKLFIVEGDKMVIELLRSKLQVKHLFAEKDWLAINQKLLQNAETVEEAKTEDLKRMSEMVTPPPVLAVACFPQQIFTPHLPFNLVLDSIRDPGNLGTIIRLADWYGLSQVICSPDCADYLNGKVVQASMGSVFRIQVVYTPLPEFLASASKIVYGALLNGKNIHRQALQKPSILIIGNESQGISNEIQELITDPISIPRFGEAESLNAAVATGILLDHFSRID